MAAAAIEAEGLRKRYGTVEALRGVDLTVETGTVFGLLGPNGAGKTTALRILTTLLKPDSGTARVNGIDVLTDAARLRGLIGVAGQNAAVDENMTGVENLEMVGRLYHIGRRDARERATELLDAFDLSEAADRVVKTYSGGMRRRLDLAGALVARPPVLFLDEPTTGLDPRSRLGLWELIERLVAEGTSVLLTTQYLDEADRLCDRIAVIDQGLVIAEGTPDELKRQVGGERLDIRLGDVAERDRAIEALVGFGDTTPYAEDGSVRVPLRERQGAIARAVRQLDDAGVAIDDIVIVTPTLDDVFLQLTGHAAEEDGSAMTAAAYAFSDMLVLAKRSLLRVRRQPDLLVGYTIQPIMFVLLFLYVFGGAIQVPGLDYVDFLMPGIIVQSMVFGGFVTALGLSDDLKKGLIDRFRSLPMWGPAVVAGRILGDIGLNVLQLVIMLSVGFLAGFRFSTSVGEVLLGLFLVLFLGYAFSWVFAFLGLTASSPEAANAYGFTILFPVTFVSSAFVPVESMPSWLQPFAENNPFTKMVNAARALFVGTPAGNDVWIAFAWGIGITVVFAVLSIWRYRRAVAR